MHTSSWVEAMRYGFQEASMGVHYALEVQRTAVRGVIQGPVPGVSVMRARSGGVFDAPLGVLGLQLSRQWNYDATRRANCEPLQGLATM